MERNIQLGKLDKQTYLTCYNICNAESKWVGGTPPRVAVKVDLNCRYKMLPYKKWHAVMR